MGNIMGLYSPLYSPIMTHTMVLNHEIVLPLTVVAPFSRHDKKTYVYRRCVRPCIIIIIALSRARQENLPESRVRVSVGKYLKRTIGES